MMRSVTEYAQACLQLDADGLVKEFTVMVRPLSGMIALGQAVQAGLDAAAAS